MTRFVKAGETGVDSSFSHPPMQVLVDNGFTFRVGYISVAPASPGKNITDAECAETIARMALLLVWEMSANRATLGATYGALDGRDAADQARLRGQPIDVPILAADDTGTTTANLPNKIAYFYEFARTCAPYEIGIYGGVKILQALAGLWKIGWVPIPPWTWSVSLVKLPNETTADYNARGRQAATDAAIAVGAHVLQHGGYYIDNTWAVDPNECIRPFPAWSTAIDPNPPQEDDMSYLATNAEPRQMPWGLQPAGAEFFVVDTWRRGCSQDEKDKAWAGVTAKPLKNATLDAIPEAGAGGTVDNTARQDVASVQNDLQSLKGVLRAV